MNNCTNGYCYNINMTCPNVKPYADGTKRTCHTEVKCKKCGDRWLWGLSWDGSKDGFMLCSKCEEKETESPRDEREEEEYQDKREEERSEARTANDYGY